jgi:hypothetical protein
MSWTRYLFCLWPVACVAFSYYDPVGPYQVDNQDPELAFPDNAIACSGPLPLFQHNIHPPAEDTGPPTLQKICAQTQYGGYPNNNNVGAYCSTSEHPIWINNVESIGYRWEFRVVDVQDVERPPVRIVGNIDAYGPGYDNRYISSIPSYDIRLAAYCNYRCTCPYGAELESPNNYAIIRLPLLPLRAIIDLDVPGGYDSNPRSIRGLSANGGIGIARAIKTLWGYRSRTGVPPVSALPLNPNPVWDPIINDRMGHYDNFMGLDDNLLTILEDHKIICRGVWPPPFQLPHPAQPGTFSNTQEACAVSLSGGNECVSLSSLTEQKKLLTA